MDILDLKAHPRITLSPINPHLLIPPNQLTNWESSIQIYESLGAFSFKPSQVSNLANVYLPNDNKISDIYMYRRECKPRHNFIVINILNTDIGLL